MVDNTDSAVIDYTEYRETVEEEQIAREFNDFIGQVDAPQNNAVSPTTQIFNPEETPFATMVLKKTAENIAEIPSQAVGGLIETSNELLEIADTLDASLVELGLLPPLELAEGIEPAEPLPKIPEVSEPDTAMGQFVRATTGFLAGMIPAVKGVKALKGTAALATTPQ